MRICLVTSGRPFEIFYGGEEKFTLSLARWLNGRGISVSIVAREGTRVRADDDYSNRADGAPSGVPLLIRVPYAIYSIAMIFISFTFVLKILELNRRKRISLIHAQDTGYAGVAALLAHWIIGVPVIISSHGLRYTSMQRIVHGASKVILPLQWWLDVLTIKYVNLVLSLGPYVRAALLHVREKGMLTIPSAVNTRDYLTTSTARMGIRESLGIKPNQTVFGYVGRFSPEKNPMVLMEAFCNLATSRKEIQLLLVGTGPLEKQLKQYCEEKGLKDRIRFTGARRDVTTLLQAMDVFVIPSFTEGSPLSLLEAMASAKAVIASDIPSIRDILNSPDLALFFDPRDNSELQGALDKLSKDDELRQRLGRKAREKVREYDEDIIYERIRQSYADAARKVSSIQIPNKIIQGRVADDQLDNSVVMMEDVKR